MNRAEALDCTLTAILADHNILNEDGHPLTDFVVRGRDRLDFANVDRLVLKSLMEAAHEAGRIQGALDTSAPLTR